MKLYQHLCDFLFVRKIFFSRSLHIMSSWHKEYLCLCPVLTWRFIHLWCMLDLLHTTTNSRISYCGSQRRPKSDAIGQFWHQHIKIVDVLPKTLTSSKWQHDTCHSLVCWKYLALISIMWRKKQRESLRWDVHMQMVWMRFSGRVLKRYKKWTRIWHRSGNWPNSN